jgi:hypothetical protein
MVTVHNMKKRFKKKLQYKAARFATGLTRSVTKQILNEIGWLSIDDWRIIKKKLLLCIKKNNILP